MVKTSDKILWAFIGVEELRSTEVVSFVIVMDVECKRVSQKPMLDAKPRLYMLVGNQNLQYFI